MQLPIYCISPGQNGEYRGGSAPAVNALRDKLAVGLAGSLLVPGI